MQEEHRNAIQRNFSSLVEQTDLDYMVDSLYEKEVFSEAMIAPFRNVFRDERDRKRQLYRDITRRGPHAFQKLLDTLMEAGHWDIVRNLDPKSFLHSRRSIKPNTSSSSSDSDFVSLKAKKNERELMKNLTIRENWKANVSSVPAARAMSPTPDMRPACSSTPKVPHFEVIKSLKFMEDKGDLKLYRTRGRMRGVLLVLSYVKFDNNIEQPRHGADVDSDKLKYLFTEIGFKVLVYQNLTAKKTRETLSHLDKVLEGAESVFVVVASHGYPRPNSSDTDIRCSDGGLISASEIIDKFNNRACPKLKGIPKIFIFQMCRGENKDYVYNHVTHLTMPLTRRASYDGKVYGEAYAEAGGATYAEASGAGAAYAKAGGRSPPRPASLSSLDREDPDRAYKERLYSDILIAHSTLPGFVSHRDPADGSWYIQTLCDMFAARAHDCHVEKLFTLVDAQLHHKFSVQTSSIDKWGFNKRLYLHPGLFEE